MLMNFLFGLPTMALRLFLLSLLVSVAIQP